MEGKGVREWKVSGNAFSDAVEEAPCSVLVEVLIEYRNSITRITHILIYTDGQRQEAFSRWWQLRERSFGREVDGSNVAFGDLFYRDKLY